jgi:hypothetical protein
MRLQKARRVWSMMRRIGYVLLGAMLPVSLYFLASGSEPVSRRSLPVEQMAAVPAWMRSGSCVPMKEAERAQSRLVLQVLEEFPVIEVMHIAAVKHFGRDRYRREGEKEVLVCPPEELYPRVAELMLSRGVFSRGYLHANELRLAAALGPRDQRIVEAVARTAFHPFAIETEYPETKRDIRSFARTTLAGFGGAAAPWAEKAFQAISAEDALGTSAAQVAVAGGHPQALERVHDLLMDALEAHPDDPIPLRARDRLYELAHAIAMGGRRAREHADPIYELLGRKVESWAPPFGMLELPPRRMCRVLEHLGGEEARLAASKPPCDSHRDLRSP